MTDAVPAAARDDRPLREWADLPGPPGLPLLANTLQVKPARLHRQLEQWSREYGKLYRLRLGPARILVVADHEQVAAVLRDRPDGFRRTTRQEAIGLEMGMKRGLFSANGQDWARQRRMVMAGFDPAHVKAYFPSLVKVTLRLRSRWQKTLPAAGQHPAASPSERPNGGIGNPIDLQADLMRFTVDTITGLAFGQDVNTLESDQDVIQNHLDKILPVLYQRIISPIPWWRLIKRRVDRDLDEAIVAVNQAIDGFVRTARARLDKDPDRRKHPANLLEAMIVAADQGDSGLSDTDVAGNVMTMLLAGEDTTANTLAWMIHLLARHPSALKRARDEVLLHAPDPDSFCIEAIGRLEYLEACAHETMRLKPVAPFLPLQALRDTTIADVRVPARMVVINLMRHDSVDESLVDNAGTFMPERWLREAEGRSAASDIPAIRRLSIPFGAGPRICPGRYLAMLEIKMAMAMLLSTFDIHSVATDDGAEPEERLSFTMQPVGLMMRLHARTSPG